MTKQELTLDAINTLQALLIDPYFAPPKGLPSRLSEISWRAIEVLRDLEAAIVFSERSLL